MKAAFHYIVKAKYVRQIKENEFDFKEINKPFENENPIIAREDAFRYYQSWIDNLLQYKGKEYISDREARKELNSFIEPGATVKLKGDGKEIEFRDDSFGRGFGVFFVVDRPIENTFASTAGEEGLIHGIGNFGGKEYILDDTILFLQSEAVYYRSFNYETKRKEIEIIYCSRGWWKDTEEIMINTYEILKTPFDWEGYDKPYWWRKMKKIAGTPSAETIEDMIREGESKQVEFKTTLHFKSEKGKLKIHESIPQTICAFLNSDGGFLFIGVKDNKVIEGLEFDFSLANGNVPEDYFRQKYDTMLNDFIGSSVGSYITTQFCEVKGKKIFCISVHPCKKRIIFFKENEDGKAVKELYVRGEASTRQIKDAEEIINYWKERHID